ncbi:MAG: hypothetical protein ACOX6C_00320 [Patescibacteria group bacterium]|jgi:hypothetical protein
MWSELLSLSFWFNLRPGSFSDVERYSLLGFIGLLLIVSVISFIIKKRAGKNRFTARLFYDFSFTNALIGLILLFFNYEIIPFLSAHFWYLLWLIAMIWWLISIIKKIKAVSKKRSQEPNGPDLKKYLP